jgi:hypothetical protein
MDLWTNAGILAKLSIVVSMVPMIMGIGYAIWPTESKLALMRPLSLSAIFSALTGFCTGVINVLVGISSTTTPLMDNRVWLAGAAESMIALLVGFGCLTVAWLCVALGMRRQAT